MAKLQEIEELFQDTMKDIVSTPEKWKGFLRTSSRMYRYNFNDQVLIHAQKPDAEACASMDIWNTKMHCWVNRGAKSIALIDRTAKGKKKLKYIFDVSNVHKVKNIGKYPYLWVFREEHRDAILQSLSDEYSLSLSEQSLEESIRQLAEQIAEEEIEENIEYFEEASQESERENKSREELQDAFQEVLASSIMYAVLSRCELAADGAGLEPDFSKLHRFNSEHLLTVLGSSIARHCENILLTIGKTVRNYNLQHEIYENRLDKNEHIFYNDNERYETRNTNIVKEKGENENGDRIHSERRLSDTKPDIERAAGGTTDKVGTDGTALSGGKQGAAVTVLGAEGRGHHQTVGDSAAGGENVHESDGRDEENREHHGGTQSERSDGMGSPGEQYSTESGGNREGRSDLSDLSENVDFGQMTIFPSFEEQSGNIAMAVAREENTLDAAIFSEQRKTQEISERWGEQYSELTESSVSESIVHQSTDITSEISPAVQVVEKMLQAGGRERNSVYFVYQRYIHDQDKNRFKTFLQREYDSVGHGLIIDGEKYSGWFGENGLSVAPGTTAFRKSTVLYGWDELTEITAGMIEEGHFLSKEEAFLSDDFVKRQLAMDLYLHIRENNAYSNERQEDFYLEQLSDKSKIGEVSRQLWKIDSKENLSARAYRQNRKLIDDLYNFSKEQKNYEIMEEVTRQSDDFITQDEIDYVLNSGSGFRNSKERIFTYFQNHSAAKDRAEFLKGEYGTGGRTPGELGKAMNSNQHHDAKGILLEKGQFSNPFAKTLLSWNRVAKRIGQLIEEGKYLPEEQMVIIENEIPEEEKKDEVSDIAENTLAQRLYKKFDTLFPDMLSQKCTYKRFSTDSNIFEPLSVEYIGNNCFSIMHTYIQNGDVMRDPDIVVRASRENETISAISYENSGLGIYEALEAEELVLECNQFLENWFNNIENQAQPLRKAHYHFDEQEIVVEFSEDGDVFSVSGAPEEIINEFKKEYPGFFVEKEKTEDSLSFQGLQLSQAFNEYPSDLNLQEDNSFVNGENSDSEKILAEEEINRLSKEIEDTLGHKDNRYDNSIKLCDTPKVLIELGLKELPILYSKHHLRDALKRYDGGKHHHGLAKKDILAIPDLLKQPCMIYDSLSQDDRIVVVTNRLNKEKEPIIVAIEPNGNGYYDLELVEANYAVSIYGKGNLKNVIETILEKDMLRYIDKKKSEELFSVLRLQLPEGLNNLRSNVTVAKSNEIVNDEPKKSKIIVPPLNHQITDDSLGIGSSKEKYRRNVSAIQLLKTLEIEKRNATREEQKVLAEYVGWGGLADVFDSEKPLWKKEYSELQALLTEDEYKSARESVLNAHYTSPVIIREMYHTLDRLGFRRGNILEPAMGIGNFFGMMPEKFHDSKLYGVELDDVSGRIAKKLYPNARIDITGFEKTDYPNDFFDVAIGNVPFGDYKVNDAEYRNENFLIHDYFFAKSLDKVRSGGVIAFITSKGTMDKKDETVRRYLAERAELLGAVRLPNTAFKANAGTEVTSDILFLQKRDGLSHEVPEWVHTGYNEDGILCNNYFSEHPEMVIGKMQMVSGRFGMESACILDEPDTFSEKLANAMDTIRGEIHIFEIDEITDEEMDEVIPALPKVSNFSYAVHEGQIYYRENSVMCPADIPENQFERIKGLIEIRECTYKLIDLQMNDFGEDEIRSEQQRLNDLYDSFETKYGRISSKQNAKYFDDDSGYPMICSLELFEEDKYIGKADIFSKRTIKKAETVTSVDTASEAFTLSMTEKGKVDLQFMSELSGQSEEVLISELVGMIFKNPMTGQWEPADEYLSGNVRKKLEVARSFAQNGEEFSVNVEALERVQPKDLEASEIEVRLGATWLDTNIITDFVREVLKPSEYMLRYESIKIMYSDYTHEWRIKGKNSDTSNPLVRSTYGTNRINAYKILEDTLNLKDVQVYDRIENEDGTVTRKLNQQETTIAVQKQDALKEAFREWVFSDRDRRTELCKKYNEIFNSIRPREYVGENLTFPGISMDITLKEHQKNAVARQLYGPNTLLAHCVGAGKTFEMTAAAMESKRLGLCKKSLFVVPNHLISDWAKDFLRLYPGAKILAATKKDFTPQNRKKFCSRIATGDYDAVIIGHSQFEKIPLSVERQISIIQSQIDEIETAIRMAKYQSGDSFSIKQMEKTRKQLNVKLEKLHDNSKKDSVVTFEQLGVDRLFVDESHYYKNLYHYTKMRNVSGLSTTEAAKSSDMYAKCRYMDEITGGTGITFATGTPISNSMTEMYTNMRYLQMAKLEEMGLSFFDAWASTFGESTMEMELAPEGTGFRQKTRFAKFHNIPELISIFKESADIQTGDMLKLPVPEAEYVDVVLEPTEFQKEYIKALGERAEKIRSGSVDPRVDNMLKITNDGRFLALDERMIEPTLPDDENSKASKCAENAYQIWKETSHQQSTQLIFSDISTPNQDGRFSIYNDIKEKLIAMGVPEDEIAFIHDYDTEKKKADLFSKVRKGQVRFLFGSTQKMGAGTNVQDKLIALHHLDVPWRPSDIEQQEGRIIRQGNENKKVKIFRYIKKGTFDSYSWQLIEKKQRFIGQIMTSKAPVRSADDIDDATLNYAEVKALATGNPKIKEKMELDVDVQKLRLLRADFLNQKYRLEDEIAISYPTRIETLKEKIKGYEKDVKIAEEHPISEEKFEMKIGDSVFNEKKAAGEALLSMVSLMGKTSNYTKIGEYRGFQMSVAYDFINTCNVMKLKGELSHMFHLSSDPSGNITRINNAIAALPENLRKSTNNLIRIEKEFDDAKAEVQKEFPQEQEYREKSERLRILEAELNMDTPQLSADKKINDIVERMVRFIKDNDPYEYADFGDSIEEEKEVLKENIRKSELDDVLSTLDKYIESDYADTAKEAILLKEDLLSLQKEKTLSLDEKMEKIRKNVSECKDISEKLPMNYPNSKLLEIEGGRNQSGERQLLQINNDVEGTVLEEKLEEIGNSKEEMSGGKGEMEEMKVKILEMDSPTEGYRYNAQIWKSVDAGKNYYYTGNGKYFKSKEEAEIYKKNILESFVPGEREPSKDIDESTKKKPMSVGPKL